MQPECRLAEDRVQIFVHFSSPQQTIEVVIPHLGSSAVVCNKDLACVPCSCALLVWPLYPSEREYAS